MFYERVPLPGCHAHRHVTLCPVTRRVRAEDRPTLREPKCRISRSVHKYLTSFSTLQSLSCMPDYSRERSRLLATTNRANTIKGFHSNRPRDRVVAWPSTNRETASGLSGKGSLCGKYPPSVSARRLDRQLLLLRGMQHNRHQDRADNQYPTGRARVGVQISERILGALSMGKCTNKPGSVHLSAIFGYGG